MRVAERNSECLHCSLSQDLRRRELVVEFSFQVGSESGSESEMVSKMVDSKCCLKHSGRAARSSNFLGFWAVGS